MKLIVFKFAAPTVHRIETKQAPVPSQPEVVLSDGKFQTKIIRTYFKSEL